jgi:hypothetical protein
MYACLLNEICRWCKMNSLKPAQLTTLELEQALSRFNGEQQPRVITGIYNNPGILTHDVCGTFYANNIPDIAQNANPRLSQYGLKLACTPQNRPSKLTKSHHWYLCRIDEVEVLAVGEPANDGVG